MAVVDDLAHRVGDLRAQLMVIICRQDESAFDRMTQISHLHHEHRVYCSRARERGGGATGHRDNP